MGIVSTDSNSAFSSRVRMSFSGTGTTDGGLAFGGSFDAHNSQGANAGTSGSTFISGAFGKISMGDVAGGDANSVGEIDSGVGYTGLGSSGSNSYVSDGGIGFALFGTKAVAASGAGANYVPAVAAAGNVTGTDGSKVLYTYTAGGVTINASSSQLATNGGNSAYGVGASYTMGDLTVGVGFGSSDVTIDNVTVVAPHQNSNQLASGTFGGFKGDATDTTISAKYVMGATTIKANYQVKSLDVSRAADATTVAGVNDTALVGTTVTHAITKLVKTDVSATATTMGVSVSHKIDAMTINAFGSSTDLDLGKLAASSTRTASGLGVAYDLGGGATIKAGVVNFTTPSLKQTSITEGTLVTDADTLVAGKVTQTSSNVYDIGISFSF
jgi:outer membrane protein OmpU